MSEIRGAPGTDDSRHLASILTCRYVWVRPSCSEGTFALAVRCIAVKAHASVRVLPTCAFILDARLRPCFTCDTSGTSPLRCVRSCARRDTLARRRRTSPPTVPHFLFLLHEGAVLRDAFQGEFLHKVNDVGFP
jgi:hypothetical protein